MPNEHPHPHAVSTLYNAPSPCPEKNSKCVQKMVEKVMINALQMPYEFIMRALRIAGEILLRKVVCPLEDWVHTI